MADSSHWVLGGSSVRALDSLQWVSPWGFFGFLTTCEKWKEKWKEKLKISHGLASDVIQYHLCHLLLAISKSGKYMYTPPPDGKKGWKKKEGRKGGKKTVVIFNLHTTLLFHIHIHTSTRASAQHFLTWNPSTSLHLQTFAGSLYENHSVYFSWQLHNPQNPVQ